MLKKGIIILLNLEPMYFYEQGRHCYLALAIYVASSTALIIML
jgi:hypothetical protein